MNQKELTQTFLLILVLNKTLRSPRFIQIEFSALRVNKQGRPIPSLTLTLLSSTSRFAHIGNFHPIEIVW